MKKGHADSVMQPNESMMRARNLLLDLLLILSIGESCWYTINGGADEYSLLVDLDSLGRTISILSLSALGLYHTLARSIRLLLSVRREKMEKVQINRDEWNNLMIEYKSNEV